MPCKVGLRHGCWVRRLLCSCSSSRQLIYLIIWLKASVHVRNNAPKRWWGNTLQKDLYLLGSRKFIAKENIPKEHLFFCHPGDTWTFFNIRYEKTVLYHILFFLHRSSFRPYIFHILSCSAYFLSSHNCGSSTMLTFSEAPN